MTNQRQEIRLAELVTALSLATDLGMGQPMEQAVNSCLLSLKVARELGVAENDLSDIYYLALLRFIGCTSDAHEAAMAVGGDEIANRHDLAPLIMADNSEFMVYLLRGYAAGVPTLKRIGLIAKALADGTKGAKQTIATHCEVAGMLAARIGIGPKVAEYIGAVFERWDGKGLPGLMRGDAIPLPVRIVSAARDVEVFARTEGWETTAATLGKRSGTAYDPAIAAILLEHGQQWLSEIEETSSLEAVVAAEPGSPLLARENDLDRVLHAFADFVDLKSPFTLGHSSGVAEIAAAAGKEMGLSEDECRDLRRAAFLHDLGKAGVPNGILDKPGKLSQAEWERIRLHPYLTERILSCSPPLRYLTQLAGSHHERLDGSGYHRGSSGGAQTRACRILAAADAYQAMSQERPYRPALDRPAREAALKTEAGQGKLDAEAVRAVLSASGHATRGARKSWPGGLSEREVEVLRLISRGRTNRQVADELTLSVKTVGRHIENAYGKIGVSSRAAAALFAMEHGLLEA